MAATEQARHWDERYADPRMLFGERSNDFLVETEIMLPRCSRVLVIGDGEGRNGVWLAQQGHQVTTVDLSKVGVAKAQVLAQQRGVTIDAQVADLNDWVTSDAAAGPWQGVVSIFCHLDPAQRRHIAEALIDRMAPSGLLIMEGYSPAQLSLNTGGPPREEVTLTRERVISDWGRLRLDVKLTERRIFEGHGHQGLSALVQVLGLKAGS